MALRMLLLTLLAAQAASNFVEVSEQHQNLAHWSKLGAPQPYEEHEVVFAVRQANLDQLSKKLEAVSTPGNPQYGKHLSFEEVHKLIDTEVAGKRVLRWILDSIDGVRVMRATPRSEYIRVRASVAALEKALRTQFHHYRSSKSGRVALRAEKYSLPKSLAADLAAVFHTTDFPPLLRAAPELKNEGALKAAAGASNTITPSVLNSFYRITSNTGSSRASQAVFEMTTQNPNYYSPQDLSSFQSYYGLPSETVSKDVGGHNSDWQCQENPDNCGEPNLDVQYLMAVSQTTPTTYYYESNEEDPYVAFAEAVAAEPSPSLVNSISYGSIEPEMSASTMKAFNTEAMKLGLMGVSIFVSAGDDGAANFLVTSTSQCAYNPSFPATSPYVTAVGGTYAASWASPGEGEIVCQSNVHPPGAPTCTTGGGFSTTFDAPSWQAAAIEGYFENVATQPVSGYARGGRGYPDVALSSFGFQVVIGGSLYPVGGTSASAPSVAGMVSLLNAIRLEAGASPLGFLNPAIYQNYTSVFNDVTSGDNRCTRNPEVCCSQGFSAAKGWDPTTGFGSVDFTRLKSAFISDLDPAAVSAAEERLLKAAGRQARIMV